MEVTVVAGNPKPASRTLGAAVNLAEQLTGRRPGHVIDVITLGAGLLSWGDPKVAEAVATVKSSHLVVVASPTFKAAYTGVLKLFLDQFETGIGMAGIVAVPLMLGARPTHAMAPDLLRSVLTELGATCPAQGLYLLDTATTGESMSNWIGRWGAITLGAAGSEVSA